MSTSESKTAKEKAKLLDKPDLEFKGKLPSDTHTTVGTARDLKESGMAKGGSRIISRPPTTTNKDGEPVVMIEDGNFKYESLDGAVTTVSRIGPHPIKAAFGYKEGRVKVQTHKADGTTQTRKMHNDSTRNAELARQRQVAARQEEKRKADEERKRIAAEEWEKERPAREEKAAKREAEAKEAEIQEWTRKEEARREKERADSEALSKGGGIWDI